MRKPYIRRLFAYNSLYAIVCVTSIRLGFLSYSVYPRPLSSWFSIFFSTIYDDAEVRYFVISWKVIPQDSPVCTLCCHWLYSSSHGFNLFIVNTNNNHLSWPLRPTDNAFDVKLIELYCPRLFIVSITVTTWKECSNGVGAMTQVNRNGPLTLVFSRVVRDASQIALVMHHACTKSVPCAKYDHIRIRNFQIDYV